MSPQVKMTGRGSMDYGFIFETLTQAIIVYDLEGMVLAWNKSATEMFGYEASEACGENIANLIIPEAEKARYAADFRNWRESVIGLHELVPVVNRSGKEFSVVIQFEARNNIFYTYYYPQPIPKEVEAGALLRALDEAGNVIFVKDRDGRYLDFNIHLERLFGLRREDLLGKTDSDIFPADVARQYTDHDIEAWRSGEAISAIEQAVVGGRTRTFAVTKVVEKFEGQRLICLGHDITELIEAQNKVSLLENEKLLEREQRALEVSQAKSDFLSTMSHEIRTPINAIIGFTTLLRETVLTAEQREYVEAVHRSCGILLSLVNDIQDFTKIEAGMIVPESSLVDVGALVEELLQDCLNPKGLKLSSCVIPKDGFFIMTDGARLRQILGIFLSNAVKFTFHGGISITATHNETNVNFHVVDTGIGIRKEAMENLFQPFSQADASTKRRFGGMGLGLSLSRSIARLLGGDVDAVSQENVGSDFHLWIPYVEGKPGGSAHFAGLLGEPFLGETDPNTHSRPASDGPKHFILVVEDSPVNAKLMTRMLEKLGYRPVVATNGLEALNMLRLDPFKYSLALMDCSMPVMDGYEATREIRKLPAPPGRMPIIALTANVLSDERQRVLDAGMNEYMSKPVFKQALAEVIDRWLPIGISLIARTS